MNKAETSGRRAGLILVGPALLTVTFFFLAPMGLLLYMSLHQNVIGQPNQPGWVLTNYTRFLTDPFYLSVLYETVKMALLVSLLAVLLGYPVAYLIARRAGRWKAIAKLAVLAPMLVSQVINAFGWTVLLSGAGPINKFLIGIGLIDGPLKIMFTTKAVVVGLVHAYLSTAILSLAGVLEGLDPALEEAAASLGAPPARTFWRVTFPLSLPGVGAAFLLVFSLSVAAFVAPSLLGGPSTMLMATLVYQQMTVVLDWGFGAAMSVLLLVVTMGILQVYNRILAKRGVA